MRKILRAKIHRATITHADLHYEGSITIPPELLEAGDFCEFEAVNIWNVTSGTRFETYTICGKPDSHDICVNGAAAHLVTPGDLIIIASFTYLDEGEARAWKPRVVFVNAKNEIVGQGGEVAGPEDPPLRLPA